MSGIVLGLVSEVSGHSIADHDRSEGSGCRQVRAIRFTLDLEVKGQINIIMIAHQVNTN